MKYYLKCKKIDTAIKRAKNILIERARKGGIYENFGQDESREIKNKFIDLSNYDTDEMNLNKRKLKDFDNWRMTYNG